MFLIVRNPDLIFQHSKKFPQMKKVPRNEKVPKMTKFLSLGGSIIPRYVLQLLFGEKLQKF